jgi:hypothetical protein
MDDKEWCDERVKHEVNYYRNRIKFLEEQIKSKDALIHQLLLKVKKFEDQERNA